MLVAVVKLDVPGRRGFIGFSVVFDVASAKAGVPVMDVDVAVGSCDIAFAALCFRLQISDSTLGGRQAALLNTTEKPMKPRRPGTSSLTTATSISEPTKLTTTLAPVTASFTTSGEP